MDARQLYENFVTEFPRRRFSAGLLVAIIDFLAHLDALGGKYADLEAFLRDYPRQSRTRSGKTANTLVVDAHGEHVSLRPFYNVVETFFRAEKKRFDYPNCAPHATQAWGDYRPWFDALLAMRADEVETLRTQVIDHVLAELTSHEVDVDAIAPLARRFTELLHGFEISAERGEPNGTVFQGMVYAYVRADAPHLHLDVSKVGAGSRRLQRVGDIDGWQGERLVLSAEVKSYALNDPGEVAAFASATRRRKALGIVAALEFGNGVADDLRTQGLRAITHVDLEAFVDLWDPLKQEAAVAAFTYYVHHIEKNGPLIRRLAAFWERTDAASAKK